jgi:hypothetical protein
MSAATHRSGDNTVPVSQLLRPADPHPDLKTAMEKLGRIVHAERLLKDLLGED